MPNRAPTLPHLTIIVGPTASGKTAAGIRLAKQLTGAIISADSRQLYTGMNIGTATPQSLTSGKPAEQEPHDILMADSVDGIDHYLFNVASPDEPWSLTQWQAAAFTAIDHVITQQLSPILVGGTMLYVDSIARNYQIPRTPPNPTFRAEKEKLTTPELYQELLQADPAAGDFIQPHHKQRIIRALEVINTTGQPFSQQRQTGPPKYTVKILGIFPGWDQLTQNITARIHDMWEQGLVAETQALVERYGKDLPLLKTMNYLQAMHFINQEYSKDTAIAEMIRANLRYAKRQMSWWKNRADIEWIKV